tara:strand:- start:535 stop:672 length:138 start_codon:yes stop_codon:yes gene_type:complete
MAKSDKIGQDAKAGKFAPAKDGKKPGTTVPGAGKPAVKGKDSKKK